MRKAWSRNNARNKPHEQHLQQGVWYCPPTVSSSSEWAVISRRAASAVEPVWTSESRSLDTSLSPSLTAELQVMVGLSVWPRSTPCPSVSECCDRRSRWWRNSTCKQWPITVNHWSTIDNVSKWDKNTRKLRGSNFGYLGEGVPKVNEEASPSSKLVALAALFKDAEKAACPREGCMPQRRLYAPEKAVCPSVSSNSSFYSASLKHWIG